ncbi:MAG: ribosomal protein S12 methylthiotransferase RimO [Tenericutes bacterium GWF2_57_13]|nr:MAG: ribosomal protein S12 methylthiotransferase RimO [Tenericutes bacterium GWF2_57_13]
MKVGVVSLGCAKNLVDSEMIMGVLRGAGVEIVTDPAESDAIIVNTCGFIESAKEEAVQTIAEMHGHGKKLIVCGCYAERYREKIAREMPYVDRIVGVRDYPQFGKILSDVFVREHLNFGAPDYMNRFLATSPATPYLKLSDGCDNRCTYCAIPLIRGDFKSRRFDDVVAEAELLAKNGAKELNLISQDTTRYGTDLSVDRHPLLPALLVRLCRIDGIKIVRVLYLYPDEITDDLLLTMAAEPKIARYFDVPVQHASDAVLKRMNRRGGEAMLYELFAKIRRLMPDAILRTTLIVGFPGETEADFAKLLSFVDAIGFDRLGAFAYSREEDTPAFDMADQVPEDVKQARLEAVMKRQKKIVRIKNRAQIGTIHETIVEAYDPKSRFYYGRSRALAPDDVDGSLVFQSPQTLHLGDVAFVKVTSVFGYDLIGDAVFAQ